MRGNGKGALAPGGRCFARFWTLGVDSEEVEFGADASGTLIFLFPMDKETVFQSSLSGNDGKLLKLEITKDALPKEGDPVKLVIELSEKK